MASVLSLPGAMIDRFDSTPALSWIDGGLTFGNIDTSNTPPTYYITFNLIASVDKFNTRGAVADMLLYQFDFFAPHWDDIELMIQGVTSIFNPIAITATPILFRNGKAFNCIPSTSAMHRPEDANDSGDLLKRRHKDFRFYSTLNVSA